MQLRGGGGENGGRMRRAERDQRGHGTSIDDTELQKRDGRTEPLNYSQRAPHHSTTKSGVGIGPSRAHRSRSPMARLAV
eukprot:scaffold15169_cov53-Isochrysis_galbana.AAC.2